VAEEEENFIYNFEKAFMAFVLSFALLWFQLTERDKRKHTKLWLKKKRILFTILRRHSWLLFYHLLCSGFS